MTTHHSLVRDSFFVKVRRSVYPMLWFVAAADESLLCHCPIPEQDKQASIGMTIICTTIAAMISSYYAIHSIFGSGIGALLIAFFWGIIIFNLDRFMVGSIRKDKEKRWWNECKVALPRVVLAFFIAILISKPLEVRIFQNQIGYAKTGFTDSLRYNNLRYESNELKKGQGERKEASNELNRTKNDAQDLTRDAAYRQYNNEYNDCISQRDGLARKIDDIRRKRRAVTFNNRAEANRLTGLMHKYAAQIDALGCPAKKKLRDDRGVAYAKIQALAVDQAQRRLDKLNTDVDTASDVLKNRMKVADTAIEATVGDILGELRVLDYLKTKDRGMMWAGLLITCLFFILEVAPLMVKIFSPRGAYDTLLAIAEKQAFDNEEAADEESNQKKISRKKAAFKNTAQVAEIDDKVQQQIQEKILQAQAELAEKIVDAWKQQEEAELRSNSAAYLNAMISKEI